MMGTKPFVEPREQSSQSGSALVRTRRISPLLKLSWPGSVAMWWHNARTSLWDDRGHGEKVSTESERHSSPDKDSERQIVVVRDLVQMCHTNPDL